MKHLVLSVMVLSSLMLVGCSNSTDSIIEEAKTNAQIKAQAEYEENFEENFMDVLETWENVFEITGYSLKNDVIVIAQHYDFDWTYEDEISLDVDGEPYYKMSAKTFQIDLKHHDLQTTVYVEYYNKDGERFALLTVTKDDCSIEEVK